MRRERSDSKAGADRRITRVFASFHGIAAMNASGIGHDVQYRTARRRLCQSRIARSQPTLSDARGLLVGRDGVGVDSKLVTAASPTRADVAPVPGKRRSRSSRR